MQCDVMWCDVMWCDVMWCDVMCCDVMSCDVMWCNVMWCHVMWCDVTQCDVIWCDVMCCDVMWCDAIWCDVMWCDVMWCDMKWCKIYVHAGVTSGAIMLALCLQSGMHYRKVRFWDADWIVPRTTSDCIWSTVNWSKFSWKTAKLSDPYVDVFVLSSTRSPWVA